MQRSSSSTYSDNKENIGLN